MTNKTKTFSIISIFFVFYLCIVSGYSQKDLRTNRDDVQSDGYVGVALVIGNAAYQHAEPLNSPVNDAADMAGSLKSLGFKVLRVRANAGFTEMENAIVEFQRELQSNKGVGVFYYSGHGVQYRGENYLIPVDSYIPSEAFLTSSAVSLEVVMDTMEDATDNAKIVILDACRSTPFKEWRTKGDSEKGLAKVDARAGMLIAFATSPKKTAADGIGRNSPYTEVLLGEITRPNLSINDMLQNVRTNLLRKTNNTQVSWENTSLLDRFCFTGCGIPSADSNNASSRIKEAESFFNLGFNCALTDYDCQISNYTKAINLNPNDYSTHYNRGYAYYHKEEYSQAIDDYTKAIDLNPNYSNAYYNRGLAYNQIGEKTKAEADRTKYNELNDNPSNSNTSSDGIKEAKDFFNLGFNCGSTDYDCQISNYTKAINLNSNYADAYYNRGIAYHHNGEDNKAIADYTKAIDLNPNHANAYYNRANIYDQTGEKTKAEADRKKYDELNGKP